MNPIYQIERAACLRRLHASLIHIEGWGAKLKTIKDVEEYLDNARQQVAEIQNFNDKGRADYLTLVMYMTMHKLDLKIENVSIIERLDNIRSSNYRAALRSWKKEVSILEDWLKVSKSFFK